jgi:predicted transcriptional regulator
LHFAALRQVIEYQSETNQCQILGAKDEILGAIDDQRRRYETSAQDVSNRLTGLTAVSRETRDLLLARQRQSRDGIWNEITNRQQLTAQTADDVVNGFADLDLEADLVDMQKVLKTEHEKAQAKRILMSLYFPDRRLRHDTIVEAHSKTFEWVFRDTKGEFKKWLKGDRGIFWVNGKAGSGKSTLMKFLAGHPRTRSLLLPWAGNTPLVIVDFYFWYLGSALQKSEEGLLRSMLFQILRRCPELIHIASPRRWRDSSEVHDSWSLRELRIAMKNIASWESPKTSAQVHRDVKPVPRLCLFIDGLDEYKADHLGLIQLLKAISAAATIKICVSSRPWNVFTKAFGDLQEQIVLEDLTRADIVSYVHDNLRASHVDDAKDIDVQYLANNIAARARGVFLWVYLVVQSLREGISEGDSMRLLRERLAQLPSDLGSYFNLILSRVHPIYKRSRTMTALYMAVSATRNESAGVSFALTASFLNFWVLRQGIDDPAFAVRQDIVHLDQNLCQHIGNRTRTFLNAICKDLLYLRESQYTGHSRVEFLHRTVYEFLESDEIRPQVEAGAMPQVWEPLFNMSMAVARMKFIRPPIEFFEDRPDTGFSKDVFDLIKYGVTHRPSISDERGQSLMGELGKVAAAALEHVNAYIMPSSIDDVLLVFESLFWSNEYLCATEILKTTAQIHNRRFHDLLLRGALGLQNSIPLDPDDVNETFLDNLLSHNVDVNLRLNTSRSPWEQFLCKCVTYVVSSSSSRSEVDAYRIWAVAKVLIKHGADLRMSLWNGPSAHDALRYFVPPEHQDELERLYRTNPGSDRTMDDDWVLITRVQIPQGDRVSSLAITDLPPC